MMLIAPVRFAPAALSSVLPFFLDPFVPPLAADFAVVAGPAPAPDFFAFSGRWLSVFDPLSFAIFGTVPGGAVFFPLERFPEPDGCCDFALFSGLPDGRRVATFFFGLRRIFRAGRLGGVAA